MTMSGSRGHTSAEPAPLEVLVVDDDEAMSSVVADELRADGHRVITADTGLDALVLVHGRLVRQSALPDVIVTDVRLPGTTGLQFAASLRRLGCTMPIIVMTAFGSDEVRRGAKDIGAVACLDKPFEMTELRDLVQRSAHRSSATGRWRGPSR